MKTRLIKTIVVPAMLALLLTLNLQLSTLHAQGTAFTYQGRLNAGGSPASGSYDLRFKLFLDPLGNNQAGSALLTNGVPVANGLFTVTLDFGAGVFIGTNYWLEVDVKTNGGGAYTDLSPLQAVTPAPYAIFAENIGSGGLAAGAYGNAVTFNNAANQFTGTFVGNGAGLTNANAATLGGLGAGAFWQTSGNAGTTPGSNFLGTTDNQPLELRISQSRALRLEPGTNTASVTGAPNVIGGAPNNIVDPGIVGATIAGGGALSMTGFLPGPSSNHVSAIFGAIGGGRLNTVGADHGTIAGGLNNTIQTYAYDSVIAGGYGHLISSNSTGAVIGGGHNNTVGASSFEATIGGGFLNTIGINSYDATVSGGYFNTASNSYATVGGGYFNTAGAAQATVGGGYFNTAGAAQATVGGGYNNNAAVISSTVGGGYQNLAGADSATVGGGVYNRATGPGSLVSGGIANLANAYAATVGGGISNSAAGTYATVAGGTNNTANGTGTTVSGGYNNTASGSFTVVGGGYGNSNLTYAAAIGGGYANTIQPFAPYAFVGAGYSNNIALGSGYSVLGGGGANAIQSNSGFGVLGGGYYNSIGANNYYATLGGGASNTCSGLAATVSGGFTNTATGAYATVGGGYGNLASAASATIPGGAGNVAAGLDSFAAGTGAQALHNYSFVWSDGSQAFSSSAAGQFAVQAAGGVRLAADVQLDYSTYHNLSMTGGNSLGYLYGSYPALGDGIHLGYNYYYDAGGVGHPINSGGATSRLSVQYGQIDLAVGGVGSAPTADRLIANSSGVTVYGTFSNLSDRNAKQDFTAVIPAQILEKVAQLPLSEWSYKDDPATRHVGPMAQDFHSIFNLGPNDKLIAPMDEGGVAFAAIQGLNQKLETQLKTKDAEIADLKARLEKLEQLINSQIGNNK